MSKQANNKPGDGAPIESQMSLKFDGPKPKIDVGGGDMYKEVPMNSLMSNNRNDLINSQANAFMQSQQFGGDFNRMESFK